MSLDQLDMDRLLVSFQLESISEENVIIYKDVVDIPIGRELITNVNNPDYLQVNIHVLNQISDYLKELVTTNSDRYSPMFGDDAPSRWLEITKIIYTPMNCDIETSVNIRILSVKQRATFLLRMYNRTRWYEQLSQVDIKSWLSKFTKGKK